MLGQLAQLPIVFYYSNTCIYKYIFKFYYLLIQNEKDPESLLRKKLVKIKKKIILEEKRLGTNLENFDKEKIINILFEY